MPTLLVDCPYTHRKFSTGVETSAKSLRGSWKAKIEVNCPHCHKTHKISVRKAYQRVKCRGGSTSTEYLDQSIGRKRFPQPSSAADPPLCKCLGGLS